MRKGPGLTAATVLVIEDEGGLRDFIRSYRMTARGPY
jgi:hypothetical protein